MTLRVQDWGFTVDDTGSLELGGVSAEKLAREYGTPLHVFDEAGLRGRAAQVREAFTTAHPGGATVYFAFKANNTPGVVRMVLDEGLYPEVGTTYEWSLARRMGVAPEHILVNGPNKAELLDIAVTEGAGFIVVDGLQDLEKVETTCRDRGCAVRVLLRINPDVVPKGMNRASATGSRKQSVFGFDYVSGEVSVALRRVKESEWLEFAGLHCHVGTGIRRSKDYRRPLEIVVRMVAEAERLGLHVEVLDVGGGFGVPTSRELDTAEFLMYQAFGRLPAPPDPSRFPSIEEFARTISKTIVGECRRHGIRVPRLFVEPGRSIVSSAGVLLLTVGSVKPRQGVGTWVIADGAAGTVAFPLFYEYHEVLLCRAAHAARSERYSLVGPVCFSADWIYRNKKMPPIVPGDVLAVCDAGAYFTVQETNFGFPRPAVVAVRDGESRLIRRRETFDDMVSRDLGWSDGYAA